MQYYLFGGKSAMNAAYATFLSDLAHVGRDSGPCFQTHGLAAFASFGPCETQYSFGNTAEGRVAEQPDLWPGRRRPGALMPGAGHAPHRTRPRKQDTLPLVCLGRAVRIPLGFGTPRSKRRNLRGAPHDPGLGWPP